MKKYLLIALCTTFMACKKENEIKTNQPQQQENATTQTPVKTSGEELFNGKGTCTACHLPDQKVIGPSLAEIAKIYKEKNASIVSFLKEKSKPIVDPSQYETMRVNFAITKQMSDAELKAIEEYMLSFAK